MRHEKGQVISHTLSKMQVEMIYAHANSKKIRAEILFKKEYMQLTVVTSLLLEKNKPE